MHGVCWEGVVPKARRRALVEVLFVVVRGRGGVTNMEERENDKRATPHGTLSGSSEFESALRVP